MPLLDSANFSKNDNTISLSNRSVIGNIEEKTAPIGEKAHAVETIGILIKQVLPYFSNSCNNSTVIW
jgi:hypothetical protein